jgi:Tfp pilus assembly protein PilO
MVSVEKVLDEWKQDSVMNEAKINLELLKSPMLHAKYLEYFVYFKAKLAAAEKKHNKMMWVKRKYWRGEMELADLQKYGWSQWQGLKPSSSELNQLLEMDTDMNDLAEVVATYKTAVAATEYVMKQIQGRDWALKSLIEYNKYLSGN